MRIIDIHTVESLATESHDEDILLTSSLPVGLILMKMNAYQT